MSILAKTEGSLNSPEEFNSKVRYPKTAKKEKGKPNSASSTSDHVANPIFVKYTFV